ncbi:MAG: hypothetical protein ACUVWO_06000 [Thermodesulfobacteriota bacterium]
MERIVSLSLFFVFLAAACEGKPPPAQLKSDSQAVSKVIVEKEKPEREAFPPPEVKIKLKRDSKNDYSWEISGSDVNEILKVNERLRKQLTGEQRR